MGNTVEDFKKGMPGPRDRVSTSITGSAPSYYWFKTRPSDPGPIFASGSSQRCIDYNHPWFYSFMRLRQEYPHLRKADVGHPFAMERVEMSMPQVGSFVDPVQDFYRGHEGVIAPTTAYKAAMQNIARGKFPGLPTSLGMDRVALWGLGSTAISQSIPDIPEFSLFRFIGELRAGLPQVPLKLLAKEKKLRNAGGEYLNVQFGIMPLVSDLQNFLEALQNPALRSAVKHQLDQEFRVRKVIDKGSNSVTRTTSSTERAVASNLSGSSGYVTTVSKYRIWSSCSFAYYQVTALDRLLDDLDNQLGGLGAVPTAIDVWNLLPWSWLIDWFTNINHVITNLSYLGRDGLYLQRGYIMGHFSDIETSYISGTLYNRGVSSTGVRTFERKYRVRASPFGFGYTWKDFSPFQLSILGALGVNRLNF
jgi:hypothetical protein